MIARIGIVVMLALAVVLPVVGIWTGLQADDANVMFTVAISIVGDTAVAVGALILWWKPGNRIGLLLGVGELLLMTSSRPGRSLSLRARAAIPVAPASRPGGARSRSCRRSRSSFLPSPSCFPTGDCRVRAGGGRCRWAPSCSRSASVCRRSPLGA